MVVNNKQASLGFNLLGPVKKGFNLLVFNERNEGLKIMVMEKSKIKK